MVVFADVFEEFYVFAAVKDPGHPSVIFRTLYFKHSLLNSKLKFIEMTEWLESCRSY